MKNILTIFTLTFLSITTIYSQNNSTKKADKHFSRLEFVKAAQEYLELINKGNSGDYVISQLAESYYNIFNSIEAEKWYSKIVDSSSDPEVIYKYAQMLKANGKYKLSNEWMRKFADLRPYDNRSTSFLKDPNYLSKIINKGKRFNIQNLDINSEYSDFGGVFDWEYFDAPPSPHKNPSMWSYEMKKAMEHKAINETINENNILDEMNYCRIS